MLLTLMLEENLVKFRGLQNILGSFAAKQPSSLCWWECNCNYKKTKWLHTAHPVYYKSPEALRSQSDLKLCYLHPWCVTELMLSFQTGYRLTLLAAKLKALASTLSFQTFSFQTDLFKSVWDLSLGNQSWDLDHSRRAAWRYSTFLFSCCFPFFKSPRLCQLF